MTQKALPAVKGDPRADGREVVAHFTGLRGITVDSNYVFTQPADSLGRFENDLVHLTVWGLRELLANGTSYGHGSGLQPALLSQEGFRAIVNRAF